MEVAGAVVILDPKALWNQAGLMLLSKDGFFSLMPILYVPMMALVRILHRRHEFWPEALTVVAASSAIMGIFTVIQHGATGLNFGFRYLIPLIPFLLFFTPAVFEANPTPLREFLVISAIYSAGMALLGVARGTLVGRPLLDLADTKVAVFYRLNYVFFAVFLGLCGLAALRALREEFW